MGETPKRLISGLLICLLYTSDAADERSSVDLGGRRIIKKKNKQHHGDEVQRQARNEQNKTATYEHRKTHRIEDTVS